MTSVDIQQQLIRQRVLEEMSKMSSDELLALAVRAGIYTSDGKLTESYRSEEDKQ
jgi:hypothetical protein